MAWCVCRESRWRCSPLRRPDGNPHWDTACSLLPVHSIPTAHLAQAHTHTHTLSLCTHTHLYMHALAHGSICTLKHTRAGTYTHTHTRSRRVKSLFTSALTSDSLPPPTPNSLPASLPVATSNATPENSFIIYFISFPKSSFFSQAARCAVLGYVQNK